MATVTRDDQKRIDAIIEDIRFQTDLSYPECNLLDMATSFGIKVYESDLSPIGPNVSGIIQYDDAKLKTNPRIYISNSISEKRKRFTLAHELGHHFLHEGDKLRVDDFDYSGDEQDAKDESEANYFAASILVPEKLLKKKIKEHVSTSQLAEYFQVSVAVVENRIKWLKSNS